MSSSLHAAPFVHGSQVALSPSAGDGWSLLAAALSIVSIVALFRPELTWITQRIFKPRRLAVADSGRMEVAYGFPFGSNISLKGTIESQNQSSFVTELIVSIKREQPRGEWHLRQHLSRDPRLQSQGAVLSMTSELARAFKIEKDGVHDYYVTFVDLDVFSQLTDEGCELKARWDTFSMPRLTQYAKSIGARPQDPAGGALWDLQNRKAIDDLFKEFLSIDGTNAFRERWLKRFIWEPGRYIVTLDCRIQGTSKPYLRSWLLELKQSDSDRLSSNIDRMLRMACGVPVFDIWQFVFKPYEPAD